MGREESAGTYANDTPCTVEEVPWSCLITSGTAVAVAATALASFRSSTVSISTPRDLRYSIRDEASESAERSAAGEVDLGSVDAGGGVDDSDDIGVRACLLELFRGLCVLTERGALTNG